MLLEFANQGIWPDFLAYKRLQNRHTIAIVRHNNESVLFNKTNHFHGLRLLAQKQNFRKQPPRILKTIILLFCAWFNENYALKKC